MNKQQFHFTRLNEKTHPDNLKVAINIYSSNLDKYVPGKRYNHTKYQMFDEREVAVNEIVFDLDWSSYKANYQKARMIIEALDNRKVPYYICATGGKGIHIHTFFNPIQFETEENKKIFKESLKYDFSYRNIRLWFWNLILDEAGIEVKYRTKYVDPAPLKFDYYNGTTHLIRVIGGAKYSKNNEGDWIKNYKSYITKSNFKSKKVIISHFDDVSYPEEIPCFDIDEYELSGYIKEFIKYKESKDIKPLKNYDIDSKYVELDSVLKLREGLSEGHRNQGAYLIAKACRIDELNKDAGYKILEEYVNNCDQTGSKYTINEAKSALDWAYRHDKRFWSCGPLIELGLHDPTTCDFCKSKNKNALKLLTKTDILKKVEEILDFEVVGETKNKILMFLLMLSKDFPSKSGKEKWNMFGDPMSQNIILNSDSSSGKSWITKSLLKLFGDENIDYYIISRVTKNAMNYFTDVNMDGKIIFIEELQGLDENTSQLRVWMSEGKLTLNSVEKIKNEEGIEVNAMVKKSTVGQPVFITNQAEGTVEDQLNNRSWVMSLDVTEHQTKHILNFQDIVNKGKYMFDKSIVVDLKDALKQLKQYHFIIPFADNNAMGIPLKDVRSRRDYTKFLTLIKCSAYLHQKQRKIEEDEDGNEYLICDIKDYDIAREYSEGILAATFSGLTSSQVELLNFLRNSSFKDEFMVSDIMRNLNKSQPHWYGMMTQLENLGYVTSEKSHGTSTIYHLNMDKSINLISLPTGVELLAKLNVNTTPVTKDNKEVVNVSRIEVLTYMKKNTKHLIPFEDFEGYFKKDIESLLDNMKCSGDIYSPKPGFYMVL